MRIGARNLLDEYGSALAVAEAYILGKIPASKEDFILDIVSLVTLEAARIRLEARGLLSKKNDDITLY